MTFVLTPTDVAERVQMLSVRTPTLPPATHTNVYLFGARELVLVEPASSDAREVEAVCAWVEARVAAGASLRAIVLTHHHHDHVAGARQVAERLGAPLWAHADTARRLRDVAIARELTDGELLPVDDQALRVVHTPGHAPGHVCLYHEASGSLVAGDMVAGVGSILVEPNDGDMTQYLASLARMDALHALRLLPAHGLPIDEPHQKLTSYVAHRLGREARVLEALRMLEGVHAPQALLPIAYADTPQLAWPLARLSTEAHLLKLVEDGLVERVPGGYRAL